MWHKIVHYSRIQEQETSARLEIKLAVARSSRDLYFPHPLSFLPDLSSLVSSPLVFSTLVFSTSVFSPLSFPHYLFSIPNYSITVLPSRGLFPSRFSPPWSSPSTVSPPVDLFSLGLLHPRHFPPSLFYSRLFPSSMGFQNLKPVAFEDIYLLSEASGGRFLTTNWLLNANQLLNSN